MGNMSLEEIKNETVDLEKIPIEEVFEQLKCSREGLSTEEGANRLTIFGPNKLEEKKDKFGVRNIRGSEHEEMAALYLQVSIVSQALIFVTRSRGFSFLERPGALLFVAFIIAQLVRIFQFPYS
ncbi:hypothetical protein ACFE04_009880 [Oxalis oulophora]